MQYYDTVKVGVFDSGIGGLSVAKAIEKTLPNAEVIFRSDREHMPYGDKPPAEVFGYVLPILQELADLGCEAIVIACNTVTTIHIDELRKRIDVPLVGVEPMVKTAAQRTKSGVIGVCATPATLGSKRYAWLKEKYAQNMMVVEPDCSKWAYMIEHSQVDEAKVASQVEDMCARGADVIVLGCTHYHWIETLVRRLAAGRAEVIQPESVVVARLERLLAERLDNIRTPANVA